MKIFKSIVSILICFAVLVLPACKNSEEYTELKIGAEGFEYEFNPFYAQSDADRKVVLQMFRSIQRPDSDNKLVNYSGGISYEFVGDSQVEYTVSISNDLMFSDGTNVTIDDVIFFYHFIADATYDGYYSDFYLNDVVGLREYYFDDSDYESSIQKLENKIADNYTLTTIETDDYVKYLVETRLEGKFSGDLSSASPSGVSWEEYLKKLGYGEAIADLGSNPSAESLIKLVARAEAENNPLAYNPENWYRELLYTNYIKDNYSDGIDVESISGIRKVNDYTCTVLFNSANINAISQLNALLVSRTDLSAEYVKGSAEKIEELDLVDICSGPYVMSEYSDGEILLTANEYYSEACDFNALKFVDISEEKDPVKLVSSGKIDVVETLATANAVNSLSNKNVRYFINDCNYYISLFFNTRTLDLSARKALIGLCNLNTAVEAQIGSYYTRPLRPISVRFEEYPANVTQPYYSESAFTVYNMGTGEKIRSANLYYCGEESDLAYSVINSYKEILNQKGITLNVVLADELMLAGAIASGKADMWVEAVYDGSTCDKFDYYNSSGRKNKTGISSPEIDSLTSAVRAAAGYYNKAHMTAQLMELVMEQAVECPIYQQQKMTVYNTETVNPDSFDRAADMDGFTYCIPMLKKN